MAIIRVSTWSRVAKVTRWGEGMMANRGPSMFDPRFRDFTPYWKASVSGATVTITRGALRHGNKTFLTAADTYTVTITADEQYVGWRYEPIAHTLIVAPDPFDDMPEDEVISTVVYAQGPLVQCGFDAGNNEASITYLCSQGVLFWQGFDQEDA